MSQAETIIGGAGCSVQPPHFELLSGNTALPLTLHSVGDGKHELAVDAPVDPSAGLRVNYTVQIEHPEKMFDVLRSPIRSTDIIGIGVRWADRGCGLQGSESLARIHKPYSGLNWSFTGSAEIPFLNIGRDLTLEIVVYGGRRRITPEKNRGADDPYCGTVLAVLRREQIAVRRTQTGNNAPPAPPESSFFDGSSMKLGPDGPSIAVKRIRSSEAPLWTLCYKGDGSPDSSADGEHLWVELNERDPSCRYLMPHEEIPAFAREVRSAILTSLVETAAHSSPFRTDILRHNRDSHATSIGDLLHWIDSQYGLAGVRSPAELASRIRTPRRAADSRCNISMWPGLSVEDARQQYERWKSLGSEAVLNERIDIEIEARQVYTDLREELVTAAAAAENRSGWNPEHSMKGVYAFDLEFALALYQALAKYGFDSAAAGDDAVWRFLAVQLLPDVVTRRLQSTAVHRIYSDARRNYLRTLWWYIHLGLQLDADGGADFDETRRVLHNNTTDTVMQITDYSGGGYRVELYREILRQHAARTLEAGDSNRQIMRTVLAQNCNYTKTVEPAFYAGGISGYVQDLFTFALPRQDDNDCSADGGTRSSDTSGGDRRLHMSIFGWMRRRWAFA